MRHASRLFGAFLIIATLVLSGQGCGGPSDAEVQATRPAKLTIWRVFDEDDTMRGIMNAYRAIHPNVSFEYKQLRIEDYEDELVRAFAEGTGPDIFSIHNTWIGEYSSLLEPMPRSLTIPYTEVKGTVKKETITTLREEPTISTAALKRDFVDVVADDVIRSYQPNEKQPAETRIYGLPLSVDTLALYYNKDLLNAAGIAEPPRSWRAFHEAVRALTTVGEGDRIIQSGAAIGTGRNVERSFDILSLVMMQNGTEMIDSRGNANFGRENRDKSFPGLLALQFYTDFANPLKDVYTWNADQDDSFEAFVSGKTAFFFGYSYHMPLIRARASRLNFASTPAPQIEGGREVNYANYWVETVAKSSPNQNWAWDFIQFAASQERVKSYLEASRRPPARRALIGEYLETEDLGAFASQLLTAKSWYKGRDAQVAETAFIDMIEAAVEPAAELENLIRAAQNKVNQTL